MWKARLPLRISHIKVHETHNLLSSTSSRIYKKDKHVQVKAIIFIEFTMDLNSFLFDPIKPKIGHKLHVHT